VRLWPLFLPLIALGVAAGCRDKAHTTATGTATAAASAAPRCDDPISPLEGRGGAFIGTRFGPLHVQELTVAGAEAPLSTDDLRRPCDPAAPRLLVVRLDAPWCASCVLTAERYADVVRPMATQVVTLDVLFSGADDAPPLPRELAAWRAEHPSLPGHVARAADPGSAALLRTQRAAPAVFLIELRTMSILDVLANPSSDKLRGRIQRALAQVGQRPLQTVAPRAAPLVDGRFTPEDWALLQGMRAGAPPPPDPSNARADDPAAAALGKALFFDNTLSGGTIGCAGCHQPDRAFSDGRATAHGAADTDLNALGLGPAAYNRWWFWDGRADSLWAQATGPIENPREMAGTRLALAHRVSERHRGAYEHVFGALPDLNDAKRFPRTGKPGDPPYDAMDAADQQAVTRIFVNAAKALAAFERTLRPRPSRFDAYLGGKTEALTSPEKDGAKVFIEGGCAVCHNGPMLTDGAFHDIRMPGSAVRGPATRGRIDGVRTLLASAFRRDGPFSDAPDTRLAELAPLDSMLGQMKTPSLRDLPLTGPYGHGGTFKTIESAVEHYDIEALTEGGPARSGALDPAVVAFAPKPDQLEALVKFLRAVGGG
jgi:cytochrome c peroxidase